MVGQHGGEVVAQCRQVHRRRRIGAGDVRGQLQVARGRLVRGHDRGAHRGVPRDRVLDLAGLDALSADLHLVVGAAEELDHPVPGDPGQVAGAVEP
ncbi:hypothetical protein LUW77_01005 [Streptomyces radiopugnans]|nr:hypothetical protein LUW77_01005 [Streptomyces radiopugnans]